MTIFAVLILLVILLYVKNTLKSVHDDKEYGDIILRRVTFLSKRTFVAVMVAVLPLVFFMFDIGSVALLTFFLFLLVFFSSILIQASFPARVFFKWLIIIAIFLFYSISNLYWEIAYQERFYFQVGNVIVLILLWQARKKYHSDDSHEVGLLGKSERSPRYSSA